MQHNTCTSFPGSSQPEAQKHPYGKGGEGEGRGGGSMLRESTMDAIFLGEGGPERRFLMAGCPGNMATQAREKGNND